MNYRYFKSRIEEIAESVSMKPESLYNEAWYFLLKKYLLQGWNFEGDRGTLKLRILKILYSQPDFKLADSPIFTFTTQMRQIVCRNILEKNILLPVLDELSDADFIRINPASDEEDGFMELTSKGVEVGERAFNKVYQL